MTTVDMVKAYLKEHEYDGLAAENCGCGVDDLAPCGHMGQSCEAARKVYLPFGFTHPDLDADGADAIYVPVADWVTWITRVAAWRREQK